MGEFRMRRVEATRTVAPWIGGKRQLAGRVIEIVETIPHRIYAEPFVGMGGLFFRRREAPECEVINDLSRDVATLFRVLQNHLQALLDMLRWQLTSREEFERLRGMDADRLTDLQRAARFLYLQRLTFGGKVQGRSFGIARGPARFDILRLSEVLAAAHERLAGVWIECLPWQEMIRRWDAPDALFVLDPPYLGTESYYGKGMFERSEFAALKDALKGLRGRFVMTINDHPVIRELFGDWEIRQVDLSYRASGETTPARELIITG